MDFIRSRNDIGLRKKATDRRLEDDCCIFVASLFAG
jgi:hypothetical protein